MLKTFKEHFESLSDEDKKLFEAEFKEYRNMINDESDIEEHLNTVGLYNFKDFIYCSFIIGETKNPNYWRRLIYKSL